MIPAEIIEKKRDGFELTSEELNWFINGVIKKKIDDSQLSSLLMSIYFRGMSNSETNYLVQSMVDSGKNFDFSYLNKFVSDKHSTGGIGDKISFILAPLLSSFNIIVPMIAGRSLAFTGGTIDKLESIPNFKTSINFRDFHSQIEKIGCGIISQSSEICPADKKLYSIRDLTGTIPSTPLICSSIMSKKVAEGLNGLVMDIKVGNGAFMKTLQEAKVLANELKRIGQSFGIKTDIIYSNMSQPLGSYAGLQCEVLEALDCLRGKGPDDLVELSLELGSKIMIQSGLFKDSNESKIKMTEHLNNGKALDKFEKMILAQSGDVNSLTFENHIPNYKIIIESQKDGYISSMDTEKIGWALVEMGCGRKLAKDVLDYSAGIKFNYKVGDKVSPGYPIYELFNNNEKKLNIAKALLLKTFTISNEKVPKQRLIINS